MFSKIKSTTLLFAGFISLPAFADDHKFYVQLNAGAAFSQPFSEGNQSQNFILIGPNPNSFSSSFLRKETSNTGYAASLALGYHITDEFRIEGEAMFQSNDLNKTTQSFTNTFNNSVSKFSFSNPLQGERERTAFLLNGYYDFKNSTAFTPYITAGVGGYHLRIKTGSFGGRSSGENDLDFAWQAGAGLNYKMNDRISFDLRYRYFGGSNAEIPVPGLSIGGLGGGFVINKTELHQVGDHQVMAGIRVGF